jgi:hypothetical protein
MRGAFLGWSLGLVIVAGCGPSEPGEGMVRNRENRRIAWLVHPYFYGVESATNFVEMSTQEKQATINSLIEQAGTRSKLLFFEIDLAGQFSPINSSEDIDAQLTSCGLSPEEIARVKCKVRTEVDPHQMPKDWRGTPKATERARWCRSGNDLILNSSTYDVYSVTYFNYDNTGTQEVFRAACCLILSPTVLR